MKQIDVKFQSEKKRDRTYSPFGGALLVANIFEMLGIANAIDLHVGARRANSGVKYTDSIYVKCITLMQIIGGDTVDGLQIIREDPVLSKSLGAIPGRTSFHNYLSSFADEAQEAKRGQGKSVILTPNAHLKGFDGVTRHCLSVMPSFSEMETVTLDQDATFIPTGVDGALYNYKSEKSFQALNTYCPEYDMVIRSEFRDGNVPPGQQQLEQLKKSLELLPDSVRKVRLRSDTAGYQIELLRYCAQGDNERFSVIGFAVGSPVTAAFKAAVSITKASEWRRVDDNRECAVVSFAPNSLSCSKKGPEYRFIAMREVLCEHSGSASAQRFLFPDEEHGGVPSLHPMSMNGKIYKVFALVSNIIDLPPEEIVRWYHLRCGKSEEIHRILKNELAGGHVVTKALGANAAWWQIVILSANILSMMKRCCLPEKYRQARPKRLRFLLFSVVARVTRHARKHCIVIYASAAACLLKSARARLAELQIQRE